MTPDERAEKIFPIVPLQPHVGSDLRHLVASQIREAEKEAYLKGLQAHPCCCEASEDCDHEDEGYLKGRASMREEAAKVVDGWMVWTPTHIVYLAKAIRAIAVESR